MRYFLFLIFFLLPLAALHAQEKPLSQAEYVRLLYTLDQNPSKADDVADALRRRGIAFIVTDGLRSLTRTKSRNNAEIRQALDEAERRRKDPIAARRPDEAEAAKLLEQTRANTLAAVDQMPDFVVKQQIQRSAAYAETNNFRNLDHLVVAVSYRATGEEEYKVLSLNGIQRESTEARRSYEEVGGTSSTGEFVTVLATIFKPENETKFTLVDTDLLRGQRSIMFDFEIARDKARQQIRAGGQVTETTITGMKGRIWVGVEFARVLRIESRATEIPADFPITAAKRTIDYDWTEINNQRYLLPSLSEVRLTFRNRSNLFESRNLIRFRNYQKFGTEVKISEDDEEPLEEESIEQPPKDQPE